MKVHVFKSKKRITKACRIIEDNQLMYRGGGFQYWMKTADYIDAVALAVDNGKYVGASIVVKDTSNPYGCNIGFYVDSNMRRKGIGRALASKVKTVFSSKPLISAAWNNPPFFEAIDIK